MDARSKHRRVEGEKGPCLFQPHGHISFILAEKDTDIHYYFVKVEYSSVYYSNNGSDLFLM